MDAVNEESDPLAPVIAAADQFARRLEEIRGRVTLPDGLRFYPWAPIITNVWCIGQALTGENRRLFSDVRGKRIADVGGADGDMAFFMETLGAKADLIDCAATSNNMLHGARAYKHELSSAVELYDIDLDTQFALPFRRYDLVLLLGILYHLKNPYFVLEALAKATDHLLLSTRIANWSAPAADPARREIVGPVAWLLEEGQAGGDPTNYWIFSEAGLRLLIKRTGWRLADYTIFGDMTTSDPWTVEGDRRIFCYLKPA
jgi:tRNA (mo5U34)-methyltransferase